MTNRHGRLTNLLERAIVRQAKTEAGRVVQNLYTILGTSLEAGGSLFESCIYGVRDIVYTVAGGKRETIEGFTDYPAKFSIQSDPFTTSQRGEKLLKGLGADTNQIKIALAGN